MRRLRRQIENKAFRKTLSEMEKVNGEMKRKISELFNFIKEQTQKTSSLEAFLKQEMKNLQESIPKPEKPNVEMKVLSTGIPPPSKFLQIEEDMAKVQKNLEHAAKSCEEQSQQLFSSFEQLRNLLEQKVEEKELQKKLKAILKPHMQKIYLFQKDNQPYYFSRGEQFAKKTGASNQGDKNEFGWTNRGAFFEAFKVGSLELPMGVRTSKPPLNTPKKQQNFNPLNTPKKRQNFNPPLNTFK